MLTERRHYLIFFLVHAGIGGAASVSSVFTLLWGLAPIVVGLGDVLLNKNRNERAACWAAYATGMEVLLRMREAYVSFEAAKYYVVILLMAGLIVGESFRKSSLIFLLLLGLLLPSIFLTEISGEAFRKAILFNLSGPFTLIAAGIYFYRRPVSRQELNNILVYFVMPIVCTVIVLQLNTPDFSSIKFNAESNFETSGGFGPNQVSTIMGCGAFIILMCLILKMQVTGFLIADIFLLALFVFRGIITFSRGGILSVVIAMIFFVAFSFLLNHPVKKQFVKYVVLIIPIAALVWIYSINITGGQIENRYLGRNSKGIEENNLTSGRSNIFSADYEIFLDHPVMGVGVGMSKIVREQRYGFLAASHSEISRLLAEHGFFGITFLLILMVLTIANLIAYPAFNKIWLITLVVYASLTINHAAMRTALPGFIFGFAFIYFVSHKRISR